MASIVFSDKYSPLFELLSCWDRYEKLLTIENPTRQDFEELEYVEKLKKVDTVLLSGGRDSGKTFGGSTFVSVAAADYGHRVLYTRQTMSSTNSSITSALQERLALLGIDEEFEYANNEYTVIDKKGKITITGQKTSVGTQTAKLKSIEDYSIFYTDEGEELVSFADWLKIKRSIRAKDVQCLSIISFNPPTREHWIAEEFYNGVPDRFNGIIDNVMYIHTDYLDNGKENMAEHNWKEYEDLREAYELYMSTPKEDREALPKIIIKKHKEYKFNILGSFKEIAEGVIYEDWEIGDFDDSIPFIYGLDFGSNDPDALTKVGVDEKRKIIYIHEELFKSNQSTDALVKAVNERVIGTTLIVGDSAGRRSIQDLWEAGLNIDPCYKGPDSVKNGIKTIQGYTLIVSPTSENLIKALRNYVWNDKKSGVPNHAWSDLCDSFRYAAIRIIKGDMDFEILTYTY